MNPYLNINLDIPSYLRFLYKYKVLAGSWPEVSLNDPIVRAELVEEFPISSFDSVNLARSNACRCIIHLYFDDWLYPVPMIGVKWLVSSHGQLYLDTEKRIRTDAVSENYMGTPIKHLPMPVGKAELLFRESATADTWPNWNQWLYIATGTWNFADKIFDAVTAVYRKWIPTIPADVLYFEVKTFGRSMSPFRPITKPSSRPKGGRLRLIGKEIFYAWVEYENRPIFAVEDIENVVFYDAREAVMAAYAELNNKYINIEGRNLEAENIYIEKYASILKEEAVKLSQNYS